MGNYYYYMIMGGMRDGNIGKYFPRLAL